MAGPAMALDLMTYDYDMTMTTDQTHTVATVKVCMYVFILHHV
jgi:hypothetical protein